MKHVTEELSLGKFILTGVAIAVLICLIVFWIYTNPSLLYR